MDFETVAEAFAFALGERRFGACGCGCRMEAFDFFGEDFEFGNEVARGEVAEEGLVGLGVVVGAFDEDSGEDAVGDFSGGVGPDLFIAGG